MGKDGELHARASPHFCPVPKPAASCRGWLRQGQIFYAMPSVTAELAALLA